MNRPLQEKHSAGTTDQVVRALRRIIRALDLHSHALVSRYGLTVPQLTVLKEIANREGVSIGEVTRAVSLSQATVTGIVDRLERRSLVRRTRSHQDKRRVLVDLAPAGRRVLSQTPPLLQEHFDREFRRLEDWEQTQMLSSLQRVVAMMEAEDLDVGPVLARDDMAAASGGGKALVDERSENSDSSAPTGPADGAGASEDEPR